MSWVLAALAVSGALAGCVEPAAAPAQGNLEAFTATLAYAAGDVQTVRLEPASLHLDASLGHRSAYRMNWDAPSGHGRQGALIDGELNEVATYDCTYGPCELTFRGWPAHPDFGYAAPLLHPEYNEPAGDAAVWNNATGHYHYPAGRLFPDASFVHARDGENWTRDFATKAYDPQGPLGTAPAWPALALPGTKVAKSYQMFPGEDNDFLGRGWTPLDALGAMRRDSQAFDGILAGGGCIVGFSMTTTPPTVELPDATTQPAYVSFTTESAAGQVETWTWWFTYPQRAFVPGTIDEQPQKDPAPESCAAQATVPTPALDAPGFLLAVAGVAPVGARDATFTAYRPTQTRGSTDEFLGLAFDLTVYDQGTPGFYPITAQVSMDVATGQVTSVLVADP